MTARLDRFAELVTRDQFNLAEVCLMLAEDEYPDVDAARWLDQIEAMAATVRGRLAADAFPEQRVAALNHHLFDELQFSGNIDAYYDPRNSYLNEVLARRTGIPITLSIVYLEVGRRVGLRLQGVSFPGHFLVKLRVARGQLVLDPFAGGAPQSLDDLRERLAQLAPETRDAEIDVAELLETATPRQIVARVLRNLKSIYLQAERYPQALAVMNRMLLVVPESAEELRDRGLVYDRLQCFRAALADLSNYLRRAPPDAPDLVEIRERVVALREACVRLH
ncbi:MAG: tetratricopeptide repeat protein [Burkholderiales bacterium]|nr:tetratricopeptide repeat protein [Burkholderiales bacterium]